MLKKQGAPTKIEQIGTLKPGVNIQKTANPQEARQAIIQNIDFKNVGEKAKNDRD